MVADVQIPQIMSAELIEYYLKEAIGGQESALYKIAMLAHLYTVKTYKNSCGYPNDCFPQLNLMLTGASGFGKTFIITELSKVLRLPYLRVDMSSITGAGWHGTSLEDALRKYYEESRQGYGIIHIDEVDKIALVAADRNTNFVLDKQNALLDLLDGKKDPILNNALVICTGSFGFFREQAREEKGAIGFTTEKEANILSTGGDFRHKMRELGVIPEIANRIVTAVELEKYSVEEIEDIIFNRPNGMFMKYKQLSMSEFDIPEGERKAIAERVHKHDNGLREVNSILFEEYAIRNKHKLLG